MERRRNDNAGRNRNGCRREPTGSLSSCKGVLGRNGEGSVCQRKVSGGFSIATTARRAGLSVRSRDDRRSRAADSGLRQDVSLAVQSRTPSGGGLGAAGISGWAAGARVQQAEQASPGGLNGYLLHQAYCVTVARSLGRNTRLVAIAMPRREDDRYEVATSAKHRPGRDSRERPAFAAAAWRDDTRVLREQQRPDAIATSRIGARDSTLPRIAQGQSRGRTGPSQFINDSKALVSTESRGPIRSREYCLVQIAAAGSWSAPRLIFDADLSSVRPGCAVASSSRTLDQTPRGATTPPPQAQTPPVAPRFSLNG